MVMKRLILHGRENITYKEDGGVRARKDEKVEKYRDLTSEVRGMCAVKTRVIIGIISLKDEE